VICAPFSVELVGSKVRRRVRVRESSNSMDGLGYLSFHGSISYSAFTGRFDKEPIQSLLASVKIICYNDALTSTLHGAVS
jgi:hypothetical protein